MISLHHKKIYPITTSNSDHANGNNENQTTDLVKNTLSQPIDKVNRKAFLIDNFDKSLELKNIDESTDDFSWVPKSPLTSETQYRPKSARNRYDQAFRIEENPPPPNNNQLVLLGTSNSSENTYYQQATFNHILNTSTSITNVHNNNETTVKNDVKSVVTKPKPKSAPPHIKRNTSPEENRKNPFAFIKGLLNICKYRNHDDQPQSMIANEGNTTVQSSNNCQNITVEKTQVVVFDNRANREELPPSPQMNRRAKCGGYGNDDSNRDQPIIVPLYYHVVNNESNEPKEKTTTPVVNLQPNNNLFNFSDSISDVQEL